MTISTALFGDIEIDKSKVITFADGIPAFPDDTQFILIHDEEAESSIFSWLQSITDPEVMFVIADITSVIPDYAPSLSDAELASISMAPVTTPAIFYSTPLPMLQKIFLTPPST